MKTVNIIIILLICAIFLLGIIKKTDIVSAFTEGAKEGLIVSLKLVYILILILAVIGVVRGSGLLDAVVKIIMPLCSFLGIPKEIIPLAVMRPISGSASIALLADILKNYGADSYIGKTASIITSSTETTFYTIATYSEGAEIKRIKGVLISAVFADLVSIGVGAAMAKLL